MTKSSTSNVSKADRVKLLQAVTKSVNKVAFNPSKARKDEALEAIDSLRDFVVAQSKPKAEPKPKASELAEEALDTAEPNNEIDLSAGGDTSSENSNTTRAALIDFVCSRLGKKLNKGE